MKFSSELIMLLHLFEIISCNEIINLLLRLVLITQESVISFEEYDVKIIG